MKFHIKEILNKLSKKSYNESFLNQYNTILHSYNSNITPHVAYNNYSRVASIFDAVTRIADSGASVGIVWEDENGERVDNDLIDFLQKPGEGVNGSKLISELLTSEELTSSAYLLLRGNPNFAPIAMDIVYPFNVLIGPLIGGSPKSLQITAPQPIRFNRELINGRERYINNLNELIPIVTRPYKDQWVGLSKLTSIYYETMQTLKGNEHNTNLLTNGVKLSGIITPKTTMTLTAAQSSKEAIHKAFTGSQNAGKVAFLSDPVEWQPLNGTMADMDWINLLEANKETVYNAFRIPLPLISSNTMTLDNLKTAQKLFYTQAVLPSLESLYNCLTDALFPRFKTEGQIVVDKSTIEVLAKERLAGLIEQKKEGILTINEVRQVQGLDDISGGDVIYQNAGLVPLAEGFDGG